MDVTASDVPPFQLMMKRSASRLQMYKERKSKKRSKVPHSSSLFEVIKVMEII